MKTTSLSAANQAGGAAGFICVIILWQLSLHHIDVVQPDRDHGGRLQYFLDVGPGRNTGKQCHRPEP